MVNTDVLSKYVVSAEKVKTNSEEKSLKFVNVNFWSYRAQTAPEIDNSQLSAIGVKSLGTLISKASRD